MTAGPQGQQQAWDEQWAVAHHARAILRDLAEETPRYQIILSLIKKGYRPVDAESMVDTIMVGMAAAMAIDDGEMDFNEAVNRCTNERMTPRLAQMAIALCLQILHEADNVQHVERQDRYRRLYETLGVDRYAVEPMVKAARAVLRALEDGDSRASVVHLVRGFDVVADFDVQDFVKQVEMARSSVERVHQGESAIRVFNELRRHSHPPYVIVTVLQLLEESEQV